MLRSHNRFCLPANRTNKDSCHSEPPLEAEESLKDSKKAKES
ncbi:hypothetical protein [Helicobacter sp. MIT 14-3879]|nr:hypothetical protein [Helicobacter sp. MIT 14-3879]